MFLSACVPVVCASCFFVEYWLRVFVSDSECMCVCVCVCVCACTSLMCASLPLQACFAVPKLFDYCHSLMDL